MLPGVYSKWGPRSDDVATSIPDDGHDEHVEFGEVRPVVLAVWAHGWGPGPWVLVFPLFWLAVVVGLVVLFRRRWGTDHVRSGRAVLAERYARGEISEEEYRTRAAVLNERSR